MSTNLQAKKKKAAKKDSKVVCNELIVAPNLVYSNNQCGRI
jgi:hypothetical protein